MGCMSASDAAPLPRLGEVFFDVRGNSRSMRLSWYADTGVAVLSIWQGGMCTGTFRLAIADLPRMVQTLQRGPAGPVPAADPEPPVSHVRAMPPLPGEDLLAESEGPRTGAADYLAGPMNDPRLAPAQYPAGPPDHRPAASPGYLPEPPGYPDPQGYRYPTEPGSYPPAPPGSYPPAPPGRHTEYSAGGGYPQQPYQGASGAADYRGEPPGPDYLPGTSVGDRDALGRSTADYPAHYPGTVTDDIPRDPPLDSFPYGPPPAARRAASRHAAPEEPFD